MQINSKAPRGFILDLSPLMGTVDGEETLSPLAWQFEIEHGLINDLGLTVINQLPLYPSLIPQIQLICGLQEHHKFSVVNCIPGSLVLHLRKYEVLVNLVGDSLILILRKPCA